jgi:hypothetical protein
LLRVGDAPAQRRKLDAQLSRGAAYLNAPGARRGKIEPPIRVFASAAALAEDVAAVVLKVAVEGMNLAVGDEPEPVGAGLDQVAIVRDDYGARKVRDRFNCRAAVDVEVVGRLVEDDEVRPVQRREAKEQARFLPARELAGRGIGRNARKSDRPRARAPSFRLPPASKRADGGRRSRADRAHRAGAVRNRRRRAFRRG